MTLLNTIEKPQDRPPIITICGDGGLGKTTLAATFPRSVVIRSEDGLQSVPIDQRPDAFPVLHKVEDLWEQLKTLITQQHDYQTLIIDSVTELERMFTQHIIDNDFKNPKSINQALGGYGAGREALGTMHARVRKAAGILNEKRNMNIIFIAHADTEKMEPPDQDAYIRWSLRLGKHSIAAYTDAVDLVGFIKLESFVKAVEGEKSKVMSTGNRLLVCYSTANNVSKNRYGIETDLKLLKGENPLKQYIPTLNV